MVGSVGLRDRYIGASGFDWATFKDDTLGVTIDIDATASSISRRCRVRARRPSPASTSSRAVGLGLRRRPARRRRRRGGDAHAGAQGSVLTNIALIDGLQDFLDDLLGVR